MHTRCFRYFRKIRSPFHDFFFKTFQKSNSSDFQFYLGIMKNSPYKCNNIGIVYVFSCINIWRVPRKLFEQEAARPSVQTSSEGTGKCCHSCILPDSSLNCHQKRRKVIKIIIFRTLNLVVQNGVGLQNRTSKMSFPLTTLTMTKAKTKYSFLAVTFCRVTSCKQTSVRLGDFKLKTMFKQYVN